MPVQGSGVNTLEELRLRCRIDDITGCWIWSEGVDGGVPRVSLRINGQRVSMRGRRAALFLATGQDLPDGHVAYARMCCHHPLCVNPGHAKSGSRKEHGAHMIATGALKTPAKRAAAVRAADRQAARRILTPEQAQEMRDMPGSTTVKAKHFNVSRSLVSKIMRNLAYTEAPRLEIPGASVFSWRPAQERGAA